MMTCKSEIKIITGKKAPLTLGEDEEVELI